MKIDPEPFSLGVEGAKIAKNTRKIPNKYPNISIYLFQTNFMAEIICISYFELVKNLAT